MGIQSCDNQSRNMKALIILTLVASPSLARFIGSQNFFTAQDAVYPQTYTRTARSEPAPAPAPSYAPAPPAAYGGYGPAAYNFAWEVLDTYSGNDFGHQEARNDKLTTGSYHVALPDGRVQTVTYTVDGYGGYSAEVTYDGEAAYPEYKPAPYKPAPYHPAPPAYKPAPPAYKPAPVVPAEPEQEAAPVEPVEPAPAPAAPVYPAPSYPVVTAAPSTIRRYTYNVVTAAPAAPEAVDVRSSKAISLDTPTFNEIEQVVEEIVEEAVEEAIIEAEQQVFTTEPAPIEEEAEQITTEQPQPASYYYRFY